MFTLAVYVMCNMLDVYFLAGCCKLCKHSITTRANEKIKVVELTEKTVHTIPCTTLPNYMLLHAGQQIGNYLLLAA